MLWSGQGAVTVKFYKESEGTVFKRRNLFGPQDSLTSENMVSSVHAELYNEKGEKVVACRVPWGGRVFSDGVHIEKENQCNLNNDMDKKKQRYRLDSK